ncbi:MAG: T9SS type A sorting domain-containing protein, partial [Candidatus Cloacimonetes bacterium]|nr:T9SS type A sorting domain-containing protein [Candidatus Cloacimonadota bacterium]
IETSTTLWSITRSGYGANFVISGDGNFLVYSQYSDLYVLNANDGSEIFHTTNFSQKTPTISYDGSILVNGDFDGIGYVYQYNSNTETYDLLWTYDVWGGGQYVPWVSSVAVSEDGSTVAMGSLIFYNNQSDGRFYVFNTESSTPIWTYENLGDQVQCIDMTYDGSIIAMGSDGPMDHSIPDFYLFKKESNEPIFTINSPGSIFHTDLSSDGTMCIAGGKAVHNAEMGNGGIIYCMNIDLDPPAPENVILESNENEITIFWNMPDIQDFNYFNIYCSINENDFILLDTAISETYTYTLPEFGNYQFYVTTVDNAEQESEPSEIVVYEYTSIDSNNNLLPMAVNFYQNYPNPFNPETTIKYQLSTPSYIKLQIFNIKGELIQTLVDEHQNSGKHSIIWNAENHSSGLYLYRITTGTVTKTSKCLLIK